MSIPTPTPTTLASLRMVRNTRRRPAWLSTFSSTTTNNDDDTTSEYGLYRLLTPQEHDLLVEQRHLTTISRQLASQVDASALSTTTMMLQSANNNNLLQELQLDSSFSVVIAGEFNAGKSTLINALLGTKLLESGALPTTDSITIVANAYNNTKNNESSISTNANGVLPLPLPLPVPLPPLGVVVHSVDNLSLLQDLTLVDTPGTNSAWLDHTERTLRLLPFADLILFVTSADRPFSESEQRLLQSIQAYRKSIVVVVNKMDILETSGGNHGEESKQAIIDFVTDHASALLGARPIVLAVSARDALSAKLMSKTKKNNSNTTTTSTTDTDTDNDDDDDDIRSSVWHRSNFGALERFLKESLTTQAKLKSKLSSPIGVAEGVMTQCLEHLQEQRNELEGDISTLNILQSQFVGWKKELSADLGTSRSTMTELVRQEGARCHILLHRMNYYTFHAWTLPTYYNMDTTNSTLLDKEWEETKREASVHRQKDLEADLLEQALETADSVATRGRAQGQAVIEYLGKRPAMKNQSLVGSVTAASRFEDTRKLLGDRLSTAVRDILQSNDEQHERLEKERLFRSLRQTALLSASLQTGALGSAMAVATQVLEPLPGLALISSLVLGGGACYTVGTSRIGTHYQQQWSHRADRLDNALDAICTKELERVNRRILDGVAPYTRFVESEQERIDRLREQCDGVFSAARNLRNRISKLGS